MPVQLPYIQPLSMEQNNPFLYGRQKGNENQAAQLANAIQAYKAKYAPRRELAETQLAEEQPAYTNAQTRMTNANIGKVPAEIEQMLAAAIASKASGRLNNSYANAYENNPALLGSGSGRDIATARMVDQSGGSGVPGASLAPPSQYMHTPDMQTLAQVMSQQPAGQVTGSVAPNSQQQGMGLASSLQSQLKPPMAPQAPQWNDAIKPEAGANGQPPSIEDLIRKQVEAGSAKDTAQADYYKQGGRNNSAMAKEEIGLTNAVAEANPGFTPAQQAEATDATRNGIIQLSDGTPINQTEKMKDYVNRLDKGRISTQDYNNGAKTIRAEAESQYLTDESTNLLGDLGTTYANKGIDAFLSEVKGTPDEEEKIAKLIAFNALQNDRASIQQRLVGANSSVAGIQDFLKQSEQRVPVPGLKITGAERKRAAQILQEKVSKAAELRLSAPASYTDVVRRMTPTEQQKSAASSGAPKIRVWNADKGDFE